MTVESYQLGEVVGQPQRRVASGVVRVFTQTDRVSRTWRNALLRRQLASADLLAVVAAAGSVLLDGGSSAQAIWLASTFPLWIIAAKLYGLYDRDQASLRHLTSDEAPTLFSWAVTSSAIAALVVRAAPADSLTIVQVLAVFTTALVGSFALRTAARRTWRWVTPPERALIVGEGAVASAMRRKFELFSDIHAEIVGELSVLTAEDVDQAISWLPEIDRVVFASHAVDEALIRELLPLCRQNNVKLSVVPPARGIFGTAVRLNHVADLPVVEYHTWDVGRSTLLLKRTTDVVGSAFAILLLTPVLAVVSFAILLDTRGPIIFVQTRAGLNGRPFRMFKFRTMIENAESILDDLLPLDGLREPAFKLIDDPRTTRVGRLLRRTSLDEIPQLFNVLLGHMSLVGPRPEQSDLVRRYRPEHLFRLRVKPGLTGPMQVYGRGHLSFEERLSLERDYVENLSLARDLQMLALTISAVLTGRGAI